jgi:enolase
VEGSYYNAFTSINETFKVIEDAIAASGVNSDTNKVFKIGINCEGESYFNKDPKDANKYEVEGAKNQHDQDQLADYYLKVIQEHPLVQYIEDPYANSDFKGYQKLQAKLLSNPATSQVQVGILAMH